MTPSTATREKPQQTQLTRGEQLVRYIGGTRDRRYPPEVIDLALQALVDHLGCAVGASNDAPARPVRALVKRWNAQGKARIYMGARTTAALAALANGTMAHAMDYDDTHAGGAGHPGGPCWSAALALAQEENASEHDTLAAFITGFDVMCKLGGGWVPGVGRSLQRRGWHPTSIFGRVGAASVACVLLRLDEQRIAYALGAAATTAAGLVGSFGTHGKPFHAGKAGMDGILAAQLAAEGFVAATHLYELDKGLLEVLIQDRQVEVPPLDFETKWELFENQIKPFASCRATHSSIEAARSLAGRIRGRKVTKVHAKVHPNALVTAGKTAPRTPLEGKFSVPFCIALGLRGYRLVSSDFTAAATNDAAVMEIVPLVQLEAVPNQPAWTAYLDVTLEDGERLHGETTCVVGHPDNPLSWDALREKFDGLVEPVLGAEKTTTLFELGRNFLQPGSIAKISELLAAD
ncbi:MAG TPA: MmgE/PrpD family protein [Burkholderiales bacterium]|nr:MmgE/PrpD family protein [Burkholderiales bacterium]